VVDTGEEVWFEVIAAVLIEVAITVVSAVSPQLRLSAPAPGSTWPAS
jgi:hypothetical protein